MIKRNKENKYLNKEYHKNQLFQEKIHQEMVILKKMNNKLLLDLIIHL